MADSPGDAISPLYGVKGGINVNAQKVIANGELARAVRSVEPGAVVQSESQKLFQVLGKGE